MSGAICESGEESVICSKNVMQRYSVVEWELGVDCYEGLVGPKMSILHIFGSLFL